MASVLSPLDYIVIAAMLAISAAIGVFFAAQKGRGSSRNYFLGDQKMGVVPVSLSLAATVMSAVTYLGTPAEIYMHGPLYGLGLLTRVHTPLIVAIFFVPVYYRLRVTTVYEYLGMRFNNPVRYTVIFFKSIQEFVFMGIAIYTPALALSLAANMSLTLSILSVGLICTFYTSIGGIKAVIWTDVFQAFSMLLGATIMIVVGTVKIGGVSEGWRRAVEGGRGDLIDFRVDPTIRFTLWSTLIGGTFNWLYTGATFQSSVQRYNSCRNEREAQIAAWLGMIGMAVIELLAIATGMTAFAYYYDCDPLTSGKMARSDQIVPYFILDLFESYPGVPGVLIGGAFCASLSSMSSVLNGLVATAGQNIVKRVWPEIPESKYTMAMRVVSLVFGVIAIVLAFLASVLGDVLQTTLSIGGIIGGPVCGVFIVGMFFPKGNSVGAMAGLVAGIGVGLVQYIGSQLFPSSRVPLPLSVEGCTSPDNSTYSLAYTSGDYRYNFTAAPSMHPENTSGSPAFFNLSYLYIPAMTITTCVVVGALVSYMTQRWFSRPVDPLLLTPVIARYHAGVTVDINSNTKVDVVTVSTGPAQLELHEHSQLGLTSTGTP